MKKPQLAFLLLLLSASPLLGIISPSIEVRAAAFYHTSDLFQDIYGTFAPCYEVEAGLEFCNCFELWANFGWSPKSGKSIGFENRTKSNIYNLSAGISFPICLFDCFIPYFGLGASISEIDLKDESSSCGTSRVKKFAPGVVVKSGFCHFLCPCVFLDVFLDYLYQPVRFSGGKVDIGGFKVGAGIGFNL